MMDFDIGNIYHIIQTFPLQWTCILFLKCKLSFWLSTPIFISFLLPFDNFRPVSQSTQGEILLNCRLWRYIRYIDIRLEAINFVYIGEAFVGESMLQTSILCEKLSEWYFIVSNVIRAYWGVLAHIHIE